MWKVKNVGKGGELGRNGWWGCDGGELYDERIERWGEWGKRSRERGREREIEKSALKEKGEQYYFLGESCFLGSLCVKLDTHLYLNTNMILSYNCPWVELIAVILSHFLQILLT